MSLSDVADVLDPWGIFHDGTLFGDNQQAPAPTPPDVPLRVADRQVPAAPPAAAAGKTNGSFVTGLNLLFIDPGAFLDTLTSSSADNVPASEVKRAATTPLKDNAPKLPNLYIVAGLAVVGILAAAYIAHKAL